MDTQSVPSYFNSDIKHSVSGVNNHTIRSYERVMQAPCLFSYLCPGEDFAEAMKALMEKREPQFKGQ